MEIAFAFVAPPRVDTALSNNSRQCVRVLAAAGVEAQAVPLQQIKPWENWLAIHQPRVVVIGAVCVPIATLEQLAGIYPKITWIQRIHSNSAFVFQESGIFPDCLQIMHLAAKHPNIRYAVVDPAEAARWSAAGMSVTAIPNVIADEPDPAPRRGTVDPDRLHISAQFAIRLLKAPASHLLAAAAFNRDRPAVLHMQLNRTDSPNYSRNLRLLAEALRLPFETELYREHGEFIEWTRGHIDVGLQLSLTESFNYVAVEHMAAGIPCVCSRAVQFSPWRVDAEDTAAAVRCIHEICSDYPAASAEALQCVRAVRAENNAAFLDVMLPLVGRSKGPRGIAPSHGASGDALADARPLMD